MTNGQFRLHSPTEILFGPGASEALVEGVRALGMRRPLLVTDRAVLTSAGGAAVADGLLRAGFHKAVFDDVRPNPGESECAAAGLWFRAGSCDGIVALGGGSVIDTAKVAGVFAAAEGSGSRLDDYDCMTGGRDRIPADLPPMIAMPTTAGTGSEVSPAAVISAPDGKRKITVFSRRMIPRLVLADPDLLESCPPRVMAGAALDALSHCVEAFLSPKPHPPLEAVSLDGVRRSAAAIPQFFAADAEPAARSAAGSSLLMAALMGGMALEKGVGLTHCLSHPLSARFGVHHGAGNAVLMPAVLRFLAPSIPAKMAALGAAFSDAGWPADPAEAVAALAREAGLPSKLSELGVRRDGLADCAAAAMGDPCRLTTPVRFRAADCQRIYEQCL